MVLILFLFLCKYWFGIKSGQIFNRRSLGLKWVTCSILLSSKLHWLSENGNVVYKLNLILHEPSEVPHKSMFHIHPVVTFWVVCWQQLSNTCYLCKGVKSCFLFILNLGRLYCQCRRNNPTIEVPVETTIYSLRPQSLCGWTQVHNLSVGWTLDGHQLNCSFNCTVDSWVEMSSKSVIYSSWVFNLEPLLVSNSSQFPMFPGFSW